MDELLWDETVEGVHVEIFKHSSGMLKGTYYYKFIGLDGNVVKQSGYSTPIDACDTAKSHVHYLNTKQSENALSLKIIDSWEKDGYILNQYEDGTFGYESANGVVKGGYKDKGAASSAGKSVAKKEMAEAEKKAQTVWQTWDKDGYILTQTMDGKYGYKTANGAVKNGYNDKGAASSAGKAAANKEAKEAAKIAADLAHKETEKQLMVMENRISHQYTQAVEEMQYKLADYMDRFSKKDSIKLEQLKNGVITQEEYNQWRKGQIMIGKRWEEMLDALSTDLLHADQLAASIVNGYMPDVYALNHNYATYCIEHDALVKTSYTLYDRMTVEDLIKNKPNLLPEMVIDDGANLAYSKRKVVSAVTQGILQGESNDAIAARLVNVAQMGYNSAVRSARTMTTCAENRGRLDSYDRAEKMGIGIKKKWLSTLDARTRWSHVLLDDESVGVHEKFSNGLEYPADPNGSGSEVYNCRCTMVADIDGIDMSDAPRISKLGDMSYDEWKEHAVQKSPEYQYKVLEQKHKDIKNIMDSYDKVYSGIWKDDVTLSDYEEKAASGSIEKKKQYYKDKINAGENVEKYKSYLDELNEFEKLGKQYADDKKVLDSIHDGMVKLKKDKLGVPSKAVFSSDTYSQERKDAAMWAQSAKEADKRLRKQAGKVWRSLTDEEKRALYGYTKSYSRINEPLRGWEYGHANYDTGLGFKGVGKVDLNIGGAGEEINAMTRAIDKCSYDFDMWLQRGCGREGSAAFLGIDSDLLRKGPSAIRQIEDEVMGKSVTEYAFMSCGDAKGSGFSDKPVIFNVYAPSGTKMMYAEPWSNYGLGDGLNWNGISEQRYFGNEAEVILQQGTVFRVTKVDCDGSRWYFDIEVIGSEEPQLWAN